ncbi:hypothetical protein KR018_010418 [Drosophila ironensis]|nr:hypothetical protein KR018_010418 [Drosophila ironensis]
MGKDNKRKLLSQRHAASRMNFLFQAAHLMANQDQPKLGAFYGKLCRNVGTKALMQMAPAVKRSLCHRCALPLIPGVNTELQTEPEQKAGQGRTEAPSGKRRRRNRRLKKPPKSKETGPQTTKEPDRPESTAVVLECSLCRGRRSFLSGQRRECWMEQPEACVQELSLMGEGAHKL